jgi:glyoxylase-like metal-dependent hydrolase (beta-lactamase superfamily II)/rhodanese-related sulfurtransferase
MSEADAVILEQFYLGCLSQASYLVADDRTGRAAVVDPRRDVEPYLVAAGERGLRIELVLLTHVHADFVPGHTELAERTGAAIAMSELAPVDFPFRGLSDGETIRLGEVSLQVLATPGHTPESITLAVRERAGDVDPVALLTGDTLFLGDVGRPDLLGAAGRTAEQMARELYRSLRTKILPLPDAVSVYPGHGAGSSCGKALSSATVSTLGEQRVSNYALAPMSEDEFVAVVTEGLGDPPAYFADEVAVNRAGHRSFDPSVPLRELSAAEAVAPATGDDIHRPLLLDVRDDQAFAAGHLRGAVNVGLSGRFAEYAAAVRAPGRPVLLVGTPADVAEARVRLARVGVDTILGAVTHLPTGPDTDGLMQPAARVDAAEAARRIAAEPGLQVLDVRTPAEFAEGALPGAVNRPLAQLRTQLDRIDPDRPVLVHCAGGYRSSAAASLLRAHGCREVTDLLGGWAAWRAAHPTASTTGS